MEEVSSLNTAIVAHDVRRAFSEEREHALVEPQVLEVAKAPARSAQPNGLVPLNRKQRRARAKQRGSAKFKGAEAKRLAGIHRQIVAAQKAQADAEAQNDLLFAHENNVARIHQVFDPVEKVLDDLVATGEINAMPDGTPLIVAIEGGYMVPIAPALMSVVEVYERLARVYEWSDRSDGLRRLAKRLELMMPVFQEDVDEARKSIEWMKICTLTITPRQFTAEATEVQIAEEYRIKSA